MKVDQILNCSFEKWYQIFQEITFKSDIIPIPDDVLDYLRSDSSIILPKSCQKELDLEQKKKKKERVLNYDSEEEDSWDEEENDEVKNYPDFQEFEEKIKNSMEKYSNKVFIKLNWSSPKDAYWSLNKLSCERLSDVFILLKSSDFINHDLNQAFEDCSDKEEKNSILKNFKYYLIIREYINIIPSMEFRCFVNNNKLIGISQRECRSFYKILVENKQDILKRIEKFFLDKIHAKFFDSSYIFDVCLGKNKIKLLDFNPFGKKTDSLLYSWDELQDENLKLELRIVENEIGVQSNQYSMYSKPKEVLDLNEIGANDFDVLTSIINKNIDLQKQEDLLNN